MSRGEWGRNTRLIEAAVEILAAEQPMTVRQLFYRLVSRTLIPNSRGAYQLTSRLITKARDDSRVPFEWITDRSRPEYAPAVFDDSTQFLHVMLRGYRKDYWSAQPDHIEVWSEKDSIIGSIESLTDELGVTVRVGRGFLSTTKAHEIAQAFGKIQKPIFVYYLGDHDPSGVCIEDELYKRILSYGSGAFTFTRLAIFPQDIKSFGLPPLKIKVGEGRAKQFRKKFGSACVELDALPPDELRRRIRTAVENHLDAELWNRAISVEQAERTSIERAVESFKNLPLEAA